MLLVYVESNNHKLKKIVFFLKITTESRVNKIHF